MEKHGVDKIQEKAHAIIGELLDQYQRGAFGVQRDYEARRAGVEADPEITLLDRCRYRREVIRMREAEMLQLKAGMQEVLTSARLHIVQLPDPGALVMDLRQMDRAAVARAEHDIERLKACGGTQKYTKMH